MALVDDISVVEMAAAETVTEVTPPEEVAEAPATEDALTLSDLLLTITPAQVVAKLVDIGVAFNNRRAHETLTASANSSIQDKLKGYEKKLALPGIAALMCATRMSAEFMNREMMAGKRFNVYAIDKVADLLHGLNSGHFKNAINVAIVKSLFKFEAAGIPFTGAAALAAASDKVKIEKGWNAHLIRHTVDAGTAPTQSSSTMNALAAVGIVVNRGTQKFPTWALTSEPQTVKLRSLLAA